MREPMSHPRSMLERSVVASGITKWLKERALWLTNQQDVQEATFVHVCQHRISPTTTRLPLNLLVFKDTVH